MVNGIAKAAHRAKPTAKVFVWPYSADFWSGDDFAQTELIRHLSSEVCFLSNFETPYPYELNKAKSWVIDYNIRNIGPSQQFAVQSQDLADKGAPHYAKTESSTSVFFFSIPYIPVHYRWFERYQSLRESHVPGILAKWHFYGLTGSVPEELLCETVWEEDVDVDRVLGDIARRDFGDANIPLVLSAWRKLSEAWEKIPISHLLFGERHGYMKGPLWLGPAHPLIFDVQRDYSLSDRFVKQDPGRPFSRKPSGQPPLTTPHQFSSDLLFTYPFTPAAVESALRSGIRAWEAGLRVLERAMGSQPTPRAIMELDVCRTLAIILRTGLNVVRFYRTRDALLCGKGSEPMLRRRMQQLTRILDEEIDNAERALPVLERDPRIGYTSSYGRPYSAEMVREKIRQCLYVRNVELPYLMRRILRFNYHTYATGAGVD